MKPALPKFRCKVGGASARREKCRETLTRAATITEKRVCAWCLVCLLAGVRAFVRAGPSREDGVPQWCGGRARASPPRVATPSSWWCRVSSSHERKRAVLVCFDEGSTRCAPNFGYTLVLCCVGFLHLFAELVAEVGAQVRVERVPTHPNITNEASWIRFDRLAALPGVARWNAPLHGSPNEVWDEPTPAVDAQRGCVGFLPLACKLAQVHVVML